MPTPNTSLNPNGGLLSLTNPFQKKAPQAPGMSVAPPAGTFGMSTPQGKKYVNVPQPTPAAAPAAAPKAAPVAAPQNYAKLQNTAPATGIPTPTTPTNPTMSAPAPQPTVAAPIAEQPKAPTYSGIVGGLVGAAQRGSAPAQEYTKKTAEYGAGNLPIGKKAADIASEYGQKIADVGTQGAKFRAGQLTTGTSPVAEGNAAVTAQTTAAQQQALAAAEQAALLGTGQELTAEQQAANAANAAAGQAQTGQGLLQTGLGTAAGYAQPAPAAFGQTVFNPITGQYEGGGGLPQETLQQYAQMAASGQYAAIPSSITSNPVLSAQVNAAAKAINPNFNPITSTAQGAASADLTGQAANIQASANGAESNFDLMKNIAAQGGVNDTNVPVLNTLKQNVAKGLTSNAAVVNFQSLLQSVRSQYATILGGGTSSVEALQEAQQLIPDNISLAALESLGTNLRSDAQNRVAGIQQQVGSLTGGSGASSPQNASAGLYSF